MAKLIGGTWFFRCMEMVHISEREVPLQLLIFNACIRGSCPSVYLSISKLVLCMPFGDVGTHTQSSCML